MQTPLQITIKNDIPNAENVETLIHKKSKKLEKFADIVSCNIMVETTQKHQQQVHLYNVRIHTAVPHDELTATRNERTDLRTAISDAFNDMYKLLKKYNDKIQRHVKHHADPILGKVVRIFKGRQFGFIIDMVGNQLEYYFNVNNLASGRFKDIDVGTEVSFIEGVGKEGMQAHHVKILRRRRTQHPEQFEVAA